MIKYNNKTLPPVKTIDIDNKKFSYFYMVYAYDIHKELYFNFVCVKNENGYYINLDKFKELFSKMEYIEWYKYYEKINKYFYIHEVINTNNKICYVLDVKMN